MLVIFSPAEVSQERIAATCSLVAPNRVTSWAGVR